MPPTISTSAAPLVREAGHFRWHVAADWEHTLLRNDGLRLDEWLADSRAHLVKQSPGRTIYRVDLPEKSLFLKRFRSGWVDRLREWFRPPTARREWQKTLELARRNVPTVRPIAFGESCSAAGKREAYFLTEAVRGVPLGQALAESSQATTVDARRARRQLLVELARLVAAAHSGGVLHDDLHAGNILVERAEALAPRLYLIDLPKVQLTSPLGWRASRDNLAMLYSGHLGELRRTELARFWQTYRQARPELQLPDKTIAVRDLLAQSWKHARFIARGRDRRPLRTNREFYQRRQPEGVGFAVREVTPEVLSQSITRPAERLLSALDRSLKLTHGSVVVQTQLPLSSGPVVIAYKRYRPKNWRKWLQAFIRPSRAQESWVEGHAMLARGIATPRPLLACAPRQWREPGVSYLATAWIPGALNLHLYAWQLRERDARERGRNTRQAARSLGRLVGWMHAWNVAHHDLKGCNVLLADCADEVEAYLIDLDGIRRHRRLPKKVPVENLARLAASLQAHPWIGRTDHLRFLLAYLSRAQRSRREWKPLWQAVAARSLQIGNRLRREGTLA